MDIQDATPGPSATLSHDASSSSATPHSVPHKYGTRIRQNSVMLPPARLRQSPDAPAQSHRKVARCLMPKTSPAPAKANPDADNMHAMPPENMPIFPPKHVMLHPDDANSKVLLAIGRSFLSVDNRAMTIKDLAEMTLQFGLVCQNVSAASQAITTYIRTHTQRCEAQQDQPLLLRQVLSGTPSDDDFLPALHSLSGGAHCPTPDARVTNFRRGTTVWYLSKATGVSCPFQRSGIRLCEYTEDGRIGAIPSGARDRKRDRDRERERQRKEEALQCGQKRKRMLRGCARRDSDSESMLEEKRLPKVKLTLRLKPLGSLSCPKASEGPRETIDLSKDSDVEDDAMSGVEELSLSRSQPRQPTPEVPWSLPPYPRRAVSIPPCTPFTPCVADGPYAFSASTSYFPEGFRRSPSVPFSVASPPPDSDDDFESDEEEEEDDADVSRSGMRRHSLATLPNRETSPPATARRFKIEEDDIPFENDGEFEDEYEYDNDSGAEADNETQDSPGPRSPSAPYMGPSQPKVEVKEEYNDSWEYVEPAKFRGVVAEAAALPPLKLEDEDTWDAWSPDFREHIPVYAYVKKEEPEEVGLPPDAFTLSPQETAQVHAPERCPSSPLTPLSAFPSSSPSTGDFASPPQWFPFAEAHSDESSAPPLPRISASPSPSDRRAAPASVPHGPASPPSAPRAPSSSPFDDLDAPMSEDSPRNDDDVLVVPTVQPCEPAISATQVEGISVYQTEHGLMRRIDTDCVNLTPILQTLDPPVPPVVMRDVLQAAAVVTSGSHAVCGAWVPLPVARAFVREHHPQPEALLDVFLADDLEERFPPAHQEFARFLRSEEYARLHPAGAQFASQKSHVGVPPKAEEGEEPLSLALPLPPTGEQLLGGGIGCVNVKDEPLSPTEQEVFRSLCVFQDSDKEGAPLPGVPTTTPAKVHAHSHSRSQSTADESEADAPGGSSRVPVRRSKRVAKANAALRSASVSRKRGSRNSNSLS